jgi:hypothetical protein
LFSSALVLTFTLQSSLTNYQNASKAVKKSGYLTIFVEQNKGLVKGVDAAELCEWTTLLI